MKTHFKTFFVLACALVLGAFATAPLFADDDVPIPAEKLPVAAQTFVKEKFPQQKIVLVMHDKERTSSTYDVTLANGTEIEFNDKGDWLSIEAKGKDTLPDSVIPEAVRESLREYLKANQPAAPQKDVVKEIAKKRYGYEVELHGDIELKFNEEGKFIGRDN